MRYQEASSNGQDAATRWEFDSPRCCQVMSTEVMEIDGVEVEVTSIAIAEITANWWIGHVLIAADLARTSMNRRCCACGA